MTEKDPIILDQDVVKEKDGKIFVDLTQLPDNCLVTFEYNYETGEWEEVIDDV